MSLFVVGGDSLIGSRIASEAVAAGVPARITSRRRKADADLLDLANISRSWRLPPQTRTVVVCAAMTSVARCEADRTAARKVNLDAPQLIAKVANECGASVIFLSTSLVFGDSASAPLPEDRPNPNTTYGEMKARAEEAVLESCPQTAVVRITKVVHPRLPLFVDWMTKLRGGHTAMPFDDLFLSPVSLEETCQQLLWLALNFKEGTFHLSADRKLSYADAARTMADFFDFSPQLVAPQNCSQHGVRNDLGSAHLFPHAPNNGRGIANDSIATLRQTFAGMREDCQ
jgi:dTDP-4-dehydrorhamnose reductase